MKAVLGVIAGLAIAAAVVACAGPRKPGTQGPNAISPQQRIEELDRDIAASLARLGVEAPSPMAPVAADPRSTGATCEPPSPPPGTCGDTCAIADHICDNATQICDLADQLPGDTWAADKCNGAKGSCAAARKDCCDCK